MIKVCMILDKHHGNDPRVWRYVDALSEAGNQVDILCVQAAGPSSARVQNGVRVFTIPIGRAQGGVAKYLLQYALAFILFSIWLLVLHLRNRYHVIHVHNMPDFLVFTAILPRLLGAKIILDVHDPMTEFYLTKFRKPRTKSVVLQLMRMEETLSAALAHSVITVNAESKEILIKTGIPVGKITVVRNLPDPKVFDRNQYRVERQNSADSFTLIYAGTIAPRYGLTVPIRALPLLRARIAQLRLIILGCTDAPPRELVSLAEELGVSSLVQFLPMVPFREVPRRLAQADIGIYPALLDPYMNMATPTKVLEYAAMGIPVVASRLASLEAIFPASALMYFEPGDVQQFADGVLELFDNPGRRDEMVHMTDDAFTRELSWNKEQRVYLNLLNQMLSPGEGIGAVAKGDEVAHGR